MARQYPYYYGTTAQRAWWRALRTRLGLRFMGRPATAPRQSWRKEDWVYGKQAALLGCPDGTYCDLTPAPGRTYTRATYPPRGRGRGESLTSPRRIEAKLRAALVFELHMAGLTYATIAHMLGFRDGSGAYRAQKRLLDRMNWDRDRKEELKKRP
jgi:hypothetical protein